MPTNADLQRQLADLEKKIERLEQQVDALRAFRNWVVGAAATMAFVFGFFSNWIKRRLDLS